MNAWARCFSILIISFSMFLRFLFFFLLCLESVCPYCHEKISNCIHVLLHYFIYYVYLQIFHHNTISYHAIVQKSSILKIMPYTIDICNLNSLIIYCYISGVSHVHVVLIYLVVVLRLLLHLQIRQMCSLPLCLICM